MAETRIPKTDVAAEGRETFDVAGRALVCMRGMSPAAAGVFLERCEEAEITLLATVGKLVEDWEAEEKQRAEATEETVSSPNPPPVGQLLSQIIGEILDRLDLEDDKPSEPAETPADE